MCKALAHKKIEVKLSSPQHQYVHCLYTYIISNAVAVYKKKTMNEILDIALTHTTRSAAAVLSPLLSTFTILPCQEKKRKSCQVPFRSHRHHLIVIIIIIVIITIHPPRPKLTFFTYLGLVDGSGSMVYYYICMYEWVCVLCSFALLLFQRYYYHSL